MSKNNKRYRKETPRKDSKRTSFAIKLIKRYSVIKACIESGEPVNGRDQAIYQVVSGVVYKTKFLPSGYDRLEFIERKYWKCEKITIEEYAAEKVIEPKTVHEWLRIFANTVLVDFEIQQESYWRRQRYE